MIFLPLLVQKSRGFVVGKVPRVIKTGEELQIYFGALQSRIQPIPLDYLKTGVGCSDSSSTASKRSLADRLFGRKYHFFKKVEFLKNESCFEVCELPLTRKTIMELTNFVETDYLLPIYLEGFEVTTFYGQGFPLGAENALFNHRKIVIHYQQTSNDTYVIKGLSGSVYSYETDNCNSSSRPFILSSGSRAQFTGEIAFSKDPPPSNAAPMDGKQMTTDVIVRLIMFLATLLVFVFVIQFKSSRNGVEENYWLFIRGDVFRTPKHFVLLCSFLTYGIELLLTVLICSFCHFESYESLFVFFAAAFVVCALPAGFLGSTFFKRAGGIEWRALIQSQVLIAPSYALTCFVIDWGIGIVYQSTTAPSLGLVLAVLGVMTSFCGLMFIGSTIGLKMGTDLGYHVNQIPRQIPHIPFYLDTAVITCISAVVQLLAIGGALSTAFGVYTEHRNILTNFSFTPMLITLLCFSSTLLSFIFLIAHVQVGNYKWWWVTFRAPGSVGFGYLFYALYQYFAKLYMRRFISFVIFITANVSIALILTLMCGTLGFFASHSYVAMTCRKLNQENQTL